MAQLTRKQVAERLAAYYSNKLNGNVSSVYDEQKRAYEIHGHGLPRKYDLDGNPAQPGATWTMIDYIKPTEARRLIATDNQ